MEVKLVDFALDMLEPGVLRRRLRVLGWLLVALAWVWFRAVSVSDRARENRLDARLGRRLLVQARMRERSEA